ncbi:MAG: hypothetical protein AAF514_23750, partial [Verrucomicrobiota bacterium]
MISTVADFLNWSGTLAQAAAPANKGMLDVVQTSMEKLLQQFTDFLPGLIGALIVMILGVIVASLVRRILELILGKVGVNGLAERVGLQEMLGGFGLTAPFTKIVGKVVFWLLFLMFLMSAVESLGLQNLSQTLENLINYLPRLLSGILFAIVGLLIAQFVKGAIHANAQRVGLDYAGALSNVVYGFLVVVTFTLAIGQMNIETELLSKAIQICLGATALALAIAMGLGLQIVARNIVSGVYARDMFRPGTMI